MEWRMEWRNGGLVEWRNGGNGSRMAEWFNGRNGYLPTIFMVPANDDNDDNNNTDTFKSSIVLKSETGEMILIGSTHGLETPCGCAQGE